MGPAVAAHGTGLQQVASLGRCESGPDDDAADLRQQVRWKGERGPGPSARLHTPLLLLAPAGVGEQLSRIPGPTPSPAKHRGFGPTHASPLPLPSQNATLQAQLATAQGLLAECRTVLKAHDARCAADLGWGARANA